jgi:hypothetical protein
LPHRISKIANPAPVCNAHAVLQRKCACGQHTGGSECGECKKKKKGALQRSCVGSEEQMTAPSIVHEVLRSPGQPLDAETRRFMGGRFHGNFSRVPVHSQASLVVNSPRDSYEREADSVADRVAGDRSSGRGAMRDFSHVRVHVDAQAAESARQVSAAAYTVGSHIVFGDGRYSPGSSSGRRLLAHELTHVIQQGGDGRLSGAVQTQLLQRDDDGDDDEGSGDKKPKTPWDPPDQIGNCSVDIFNLKKFVNCCTEAIGDGKICTDQGRKYIDSLKKHPCPEPAKRPDGTCCPLPMIWDGLTGRCSKHISPLGTHPTGPGPTGPSPDLPKCLPGEKLNLWGNCCKPGDKMDQSGHFCPQETPATPNYPPDAPVHDTPAVTGKSAAPPADKFIVHFLLDNPKVGVTNTSSNLLSSLTLAGKSEWTSVLGQLKANPSWKFQLVGKASPEGPDTYNLDLGKRRAQMVAKALIENGIDRSRIVEVSPECTKVEPGLYSCGEEGASGPEDRQVKFDFAKAAGATP